MSLNSLEILCSECGEVALVKREPVYEDFKKIGESFKCTSCGHVYEKEADVPFREKKSDNIFSDDEIPVKLDIFKVSEKGTNCRHCKHYVVNPFTQRCDLHEQREIQATDLCDDFEKQED